MARLDRSGRLSARPLLAALGWHAGHRVDVDILDRVIVITSTVTGRHAVTARSELVLPATLRQWCGIGCGSPVLLAAYCSVGLVAVHPASTVAQLLHDLHIRLAGAGHAG